MIGISAQIDRYSVGSSQAAAIHKVDIRDAEVFLSKYLVGHGIPRRSGWRRRRRSRHVVLEHTVVIGVGDVQIVGAIGAQQKRKEECNGVRDIQTITESQVGDGV